MTELIENIASEAVFAVIALAFGWLWLKARSTLASLGKGKMTVSPDNSKVANEVGGEIYITDKSGTWNATHHKAPDVGAVWSPNSKTIAFVSSRDGSWQAWAVDTITSRIARLTEMAGSPRPIKWEDNGDLILEMGGSYLVVRAGEIEKRLS